MHEELFTVYTVEFHNQIKIPDQKLWVYSKNISNFLHLNFCDAAFSGHHAPVRPTINAQEVALQNLIKWRKNIQWHFPPVIDTKFGTFVKVSFVIVKLI